MINELNHVGGRVQDLEASLAFYGGLGAEVVDRLFMPGARVNRVHIQLASSLVELLYHEEPDPQASYGLNHIRFMTDDLDGDYARLMALGYAEISSPRVAGSGQGRLAFLSDPNGVRVELLQRSEEFRIAPITHGPVQEFTHIGIAAPDFAAAVEFYGTHLGMTRVAEDTFRLGPDTLKLIPPPATPIAHLDLHHAHPHALHHRPRQPPHPLPPHRVAGGLCHGCPAAEPVANWIWVFPSAPKRSDFSSDCGWFTPPEPQIRAISPLYPPPSSTGR
ncbi:VOC family protein [Kribbella sp. NPDC048915]|uniref:VOC family protein n=1 Tax=Kribbella sp. NPDC048915 TaxID=3155148 RepID=UPI0033E0F301